MQCLIRARLGEVPTPVRRRLLGSMKRVIAPCAPSAPPDWHVATRPCVRRRPAGARVVQRSREGGFIGGTDRRPHAPWTARPTSRTTPDRLEDPCNAPFTRSATQVSRDWQALTSVPRLPFVQGGDWSTSAGLRPTISPSLRFTIGGMVVSVDVQTVLPRMLAAVRREVAPGAVGSAWGPAVGKVWDFIRSQSGLWTDGHNIFLYHHTKQPGARLLCDFGVEITRTFETAGEVYATETPGGEAAVAVYRGPYSRLDEAYDAIDKWMVANRRESAGHSWEIYGDPTPDPADTETTVVHLLK